LGGINPRFLAFKILKINSLFIACYNLMQERFSFLSGKQNLACISASLHLPIVQFNTALIFRSFEPSPWYVAAWKWLLPIARQAFFAIGYRPKEPAIDSSQLFWADFHFLSLRSKLSSLNRRNQSLYVVSDKALSPQASTSIRCDSAAEFFKLKQKSKASRICFFFSKKLDMITKEKMYVVV